jgi:hypothetical protein
MELSEVLFRYHKQTEDKRSDTQAPSLKVKRIETGLIQRMTSGQ